VSAEDYMHIILGILSLKYISDRYKVGIKNIIANGLNEEVVSPEELYDVYNTFKVTEKSS